MTELVQAYTHEAGVRNLEREIANVMRKVARTRGRGPQAQDRRSTSRSSSTYLGPPRFEYGELEAEDQIGSATGLVVTEVGGDVVAIEVTRMDGKEDFILTGQLGEVMRESARAGLSWIRTPRRGAGHQPRDVREADPPHPRPGRGDPEGRPVRGDHDGHRDGLGVHRASRCGSDLAMTGEITLRGRVLPIGGLKSKILAAHLVGRQDGRSSRARTRRTSGTSRTRSASSSRSCSRTRWTRSSRRRSGGGQSRCRPRPRPRPTSPGARTSRRRRPADSEAELPARAAGGRRLGRERAYGHARVPGLLQDPRRPEDRDARPTSRRPTGSWPGNGTRTSSRVTRPPSGGSRRSTRRTPSSRTRASAPSTTASARDWEAYARAGAGAARSRRPRSVRARAARSPGH